VRWAPRTPRSCFFVFGNFPERYTPVAADLVVSADMQRAWTTFAAAGTPTLAPVWPRYDPPPRASRCSTTRLPRQRQFATGRCAELRRLGILP